MPQSEASIPPRYRASYEQSVALTRSQWNEPAFAAAWAEGRNMTLEQLTFPDLVGQGHLFRTHESSR